MNCLTQFLPIPSEREKPLVALLDDEEALLEVLGEELRSEGYDVMTFGYKDDFLCYLRHNPERVPDLVISDIKSPRMDGLEFLRQFRLDPDRRHVPVIILSGNIPKLEKEARNLGAHSCLSKPYDFNILLNIIKEQTV